MRFLVMFGSLPTHVLNFIAGDKGSSETILGQRYFVNCIARFFQNLSTLLGCSCFTN